MSILVVGGTRGLGASLVKYFSSLSSTKTVYATTRSSSPSSPPSEKTTWVPSIDLLKPTCGTDLAGSSALASVTLDVVIIVAGIFKKESFGQANWDDEIATYTTCTIAPVFLVQELVQQGKVKEGSKIILVSSEAGSVTLRNDAEEMYSHHGSKAALNMVGKLLALDCKKKGVALGLVHPSFMRTEMTAGVGFDQFWDAGGALTPDDAAKLVADWTLNEFDISKAGELWAPRGTKDIGSWDEVMGKDTASDKPVKLPW